jgi:hypothetical protein
MTYYLMLWEVEFDDSFELEFDEFSQNVQDELLARAKVIAQFGPNLGRPNVDTLKGSKHTNMVSTWPRPLSAVLKYDHDRARCNIDEGARWVRTN